MSEIMVKDKEIAVPGETLAIGMDVLQGMGTYRDGENLMANRLGLVMIDGRVIKLFLYQESTRQKHMTLSYALLLMLGLTGGV